MFSQFDENKLLMKQLARSPPPLKEEKAPPLSQTGEGWTKDHVAINPTGRKFAHELIKITTHSYAKMRT